MAKVSVGDIVLSMRGHDKDNYFLVIDAQENKAFIADGRVRKLTSVKEKNVKHLKTVKVAILRDIAIRIRQGQPVGNERLFKAIRSELKKQED